MKKLLLIILAIMNFAVLHGQQRKSHSSFVSDPEKGLYVGVSYSDDAMLGQQRALASALMQYDSNRPDENTGSHERAGKCSIVIVDMDVVGGETRFLFSIHPDGDYTYVIENSISSTTLYEDEKKKEQAAVTTTIKVSYSKTESDEAVEWNYVEFMREDREDDAVTKYQSDINSFVTYKKE